MSTIRKGADFGSLPANITSSKLANIGAGLPFLLLQDVPLQVIALIGLCRQPHCFYVMWLRIRSNGVLA